MYRSKTIILFVLLTFATKCIAQKLPQPVLDTIYLCDYFYADVGFNYRGSTTVFFPNGDSVLLQTKAVQIMPVDFDQYAMLRIILPKDSSITLLVRFTAKKRRMLFEHTEQITLRQTKQKPAFWFGRVLIENCGKRRINNCPFKLMNSDNFTRAFIRTILERNVEKGVTHIYNAATGELIENPVFYN